MFGIKKLEDKVNNLEDTLMYRSADIETLKK